MSLYVDILGTQYMIEYVDYNLDEYLKENKLNGYCDMLLKRIAIANKDTLPNLNDYTPDVKRMIEKRTLRHEIVHAFLHESGLDADSLQPEIAWARNEEMVDWFALQSPKIFKVFQEVDAL